jgi:hypothetical protein
MVLASIRDQYRHLGVLIEDLLDTTVVDALPRVLLTGSAVVGFLGIAEIFRMGKIVWRVQIGVTAGGWGIIVLVQGYRESVVSPQQVGEELTRGEGGGVQRVGEAGLVVVKSPIGVVILVVPHDNSGHREAKGWSLGEGWKAVPGDLRGTQRHRLRWPTATSDEVAQS